MLQVEVLHGTGVMCRIILEMALIRLEQQLDLGPLCYPSFGLRGLHLAGTSLSVFLCPFFLLFVSILGIVIFNPLLRSMFTRFRPGTCHRTNAFCASACLSVLFVSSGFVPVHIEGSKFDSY